VAVDRGHLQRPRIDGIDLVAQVFCVGLGKTVVEAGIQVRVLVAGNQQRDRQQRHGVIAELGQLIPFRQCQSIPHGARLGANRAGSSAARGVHFAAGIFGSKRISLPSCNFSLAAWPALSSST
jgi:hypothetical protein